MLTKAIIKILNNVSQSTKSQNLKYISSTDSILCIKNNQTQLKELHDNVFLSNKEVEEAIHYEVYLSSKQTFKSIARFI